MEAGAPASGGAGDGTNTSAALADAPTHTRATVFGLDVWAAGRLPFLEHAAAEPTGRPLRSPSPPSPRRRRTGRRVAEVVCDQRERDGAVAFRIEAHPEAGYLIWGPAYGRQLLSGGGPRAACVPDGAPRGGVAAAADRPDAAVRRGAARSGGLPRQRGGRRRAARSRSSVPRARARPRSRSRSAGAGRASWPTTCSRSSASASACWRHPGTPVAGLDHAEAQRWSAPASRRVSRSSRSTRASGWCACAPSPRRRRCAALFFLDRRPDGPAEPRFEPAADARLLLAATFNSVLTGSQRLREQLEVCALAARVPRRAGARRPRRDAAELAAAVQLRMGARRREPLARRRLRPPGRAPGPTGSPARWRPTPRPCSSRRRRCGSPTAGRRRPPGQPAVPARRVTSTTRAREELTPRRADGPVRAAGSHDRSRHEADARGAATRRWGPQRRCCRACAATSCCCSGIWSTGEGLIARDQLGVRLLCLHHADGCAALRRRGPPPARPACRAARRRTPPAWRTGSRSATARGRRPCTAGVRRLSPGGAAAARPPRRPRCERYWAPRFAEPLELPPARARSHAARRAAPRGEPPDRRGGADGRADERRPGLLVGGGALRRARPGRGCTRARRSSPSTRRWTSRS